MLSPAQLSELFQASRPESASGRVPLGDKLVNTAFDREQYCSERQLSLWGQTAVCTSRAWKLHVRDKDNFLMLEQYRVCSLLAHVRTMPLVFVLPRVRVVPLVFVLAHIRTMPRCIRTSSCHVRPLFCDAFVSSRVHCCVFAMLLLLLVCCRV